MKPLPPTREAIRWAGDAPEIHMSLAEIFVRQEKWEPAIGEYQKALELDTTNFAAHYALGSIFEIMGEQARAIDELLKAIESMVKTKESIRNSNVFSSVDVRRAGAYFPYRANFCLTDIIDPAGTLTVSAATIPRPSGVFCHDGTGYGPVNEIGTGMQVSTNTRTASQPSHLLCLGSGATSSIGAGCRKPLNLPINSSKRPEYPPSR